MTPVRNGDAVMDPGERFFLCFGPPKSGTTFLQRMLDLHPQVSCPAEHQLEQLSHFLDTALDAYFEVLQAIDRRSGGQGVTARDPEASLAILRNAALELSRSAARGKPVHGLNDNGFFFNFAMASRLFGSSKMLAIVRNPVDLAISTWSYNQRLARTDPDHAAGHLGMLANPQGTLEGFVLHRSAWYRLALGRFLDEFVSRPNVMLIRYERLVRSKSEELRRILRFLDVRCDEATIGRIIEESTPEAMATRSTRPEFYGVGADGGRFVVSAEVRERVFHDCRSVLERIGYEAAELESG
jgi:hypothetical protein